MISAASRASCTRSNIPRPARPDAAKAAIELARSSHLEADTQWGLDHGAWSVLIQMFPKADIPCSSSRSTSIVAPKAHLDLARELKPLREKGVLVIGSGNLVHNLMALAPGAPAYDWAQAFDAEMAKRIDARDAEGAAAALSASRVARLAHPSPEHFLP